MSSAWRRRARPSLSSPGSTVRYRLIFSMPEDGEIREGKRRRRGAGQAQKRRREVGDGGSRQRPRPASSRGRRGNRDGGASNSEGRDSSSKDSGRGRKGGGGGGVQRSKQGGRGRSGGRRGRGKGKTSDPPPVPAATVAVVGVPSAGSAMGTGRGRGRGATLPAWMTKPGTAAAGGAAPAPIQPTSPPQRPPQAAGVASRHTREIDMGARVAELPAPSSYQHAHRDAVGDRSRTTTSRGVMRGRSSRPVAAGRGRGATLPAWMTRGAATELVEPGVVPGMGRDVSQPYTPQHGEQQRHPVPPSSASHLVATVGPRSGHDNVAHTGRQDGALGATNGNVARTSLLGRPSHEGLPGQDDRRVRDTTARDRHYHGQHVEHHTSRVHSEGAMDSARRRSQESRLPSLPHGAGEHWDSGRGVAGEGRALSPAEERHGSARLAHPEDAFARERGRYMTPHTRKPAAAAQDHSRSALSGQVVSGAAAPVPVAAHSGVRGATGVLGAAPQAAQHAEAQTPSAPAGTGDALPRGWSEVFSTEHRVPYYWHHATGRVQWVRPVSEDPPADIPQHAPTR